MSKRSERRDAHKRFEQLVREREKLMALEPGAGADNPIQVRSASQIEPHARSLHCPRCGPHLRTEHEKARVHEARVWRIVELKCVRCGRPRTVHFVIVEPLLQ